MKMTEITALIVRFVQVRNNFIHLHSNLLNKFRNSQNATIFVEIKSNNRLQYCSCSPTPLNFNGENALNIDPSFAKTLGLMQSDSVIISKSKTLQPLEMIYVTPLCVDDWNIVENSAETVQLTLLNQIRVVNIHQVFKIWISKSFTIEVHVDSLNSGMTYGILEPNTRVVVSSNPKVCTECNNDPVNLNEDASVNVWSFLKDVFYSFSVANENAIPVKEENETSLKFNYNGIFRCVLFDSATLNFSSKLYNFPFNVFIAKKYLRYTSKDSSVGYVMCRLTTIPLVSTNGSKDSKNTDSNETTNFLSGAPSLSIFVHAHLIEDENIVDKVTFNLLNSYPSVFVPKALQHCLDLKFNSKVKFDLCNESPKMNNGLEINYNILKGEDVGDREDIIVEIKNELCSYAKLYKKLILNNNTVFSLSPIPYVFHFSFNPANQPFVELDFEDINASSFHIASCKTDATWNDAIEYATDTDLISLSFFEDIVRKLKLFLLLKLKLIRIKNSSNIVIDNLTLLEGDIGAGKTTILKMLCGNLSSSLYGIFTKTIDCKTLKGKMMPKLKKMFTTALLECVNFQPAILFLDDLDILFAVSKDHRHEGVENGMSYSLRLSHMISDLIRSFSKFHISILATARDVSCFESCLFSSRGASLFSSSLRIPSLNEIMRKEAFVEFLLQRSNVIIPKFILEEDNLHSIVERMNGYCIQDVFDLVDRLCFEALKRQFSVNVTFQKPEICNSDIDDAVSAMVPLSLKGIDFYKNSTISWKDVGGLEEAKQQLVEVLIWPACYPKIFEQCPLKMQSGVLLFGVPGSGKTLLAGAVAGESGLNFISIKGPELLSKFVGASEEGIRNTFRKAQNARPCILFFDEFDSLAPRRGNDITGATDRVVNQLLTALDGVEAVSGVWTLAATSRPDLIDPALLRPGRLGTLIHCPLPNQEERHSILQVISASVDLSDDVDLNTIANMTEGYTGADLRALLYSALIHADKLGQFQMKSTPTDQTMVEETFVETKASEINMQCLVKAVQEMKPSLKVEERKQYENIYKRFLRTEENYEIKIDEQRLTYA